MTQLIVNKIMTPDGTILESRGVHDYRTYVDTISGEEYMVDGGLNYLRRNKNNVPYKELSVYVDDAHELVRESFSWGTYGKDADQPLRYVLLKDMSDNHINAILETVVLSRTTNTAFRNELEYRKINNIEVTE